MNIIGIYKITNTVTGDFYIGSSKNVKHRWAEHKCKSVWKNYPSKQLYKDMNELGVDKFVFQILAEVEVEHLKEAEQKFIEMLKPTYNDRNANGWDIERRKEFQKKYQKEYIQSDKCKESHKKYYNQLCSYNGETLTLSALKERFQRRGIDHPTIEAKKYLIEN